LKRIEPNVFDSLSLSIIVPSTILFIASDIAEEPNRITICGLDSCREYNRWERMQRSAMRIDFRRICWFSSGLPSLSDCLFDFSGLIENSQLKASDVISTQLSQESDDDHWIIMKSTNLSVCAENCHLEKTVEMLMNLRHPCISGVIGVALPTESNVLTIIVSGFGDNSLSTIVSTSPLWWTPTAKAKAIAGLVLGLCFAHSFGILHGHSTGNTVFFNEIGVIQISDFGLNGLGELEDDDGVEMDIGGFSGESWTPTVDIRAFTRILSEIVVGASAEHGCGSSGIPSFVLEIIGNGESAELKAVESFSDILKMLKLHNFQIIEGVDVEEVSDFVKWIEMSETLIE
jgi:serine/threonine protein kinase